VADGSWRSRPAPAATASGAAGTGREPATGSRSLALALAGRLLSGLVLPPGTRPVRIRVLPVLLRQPQGPGGGHEARVHRFFQVSAPITAVQGFLMAHHPARSRRSGYGQEMDQGSGKASGTTVRPGDITMASITYAPRSLPAGIDSAELDIAVVGAPGGGSLVRADADAIWYPPRSAAEQIDPARYRAAVVSIGLMNPRPRTVTRTFPSARVIAGLARLVNALPGAPYQPANCPAIVASYRITFIPAATAPRIVVTPSGCATVGVTVAGAAQPPLWGDTGLIGVARRLLHVKTLV
jgi:hypothetical protein